MKKAKTMVIGLAAGLALAAGARVVSESDGVTAAAPLKAEGRYVVAVSAETHALAPWREVAEALRVKYQAEIAVFPEGEPEAALETLRRVFPNYVCFVARPEECGRDFVVAVHRLTRRLDDDPYGDVLWGIVTGYEAADALRLARLSEPLAVRRGATSMGAGLLERMESGFASNEDDVTDFWTKAPGAAEAEHRKVAPDAARAWAEALDTRPVDVLYTSGHATERDWQIAYNLPGGAIRHENGRLFTESADKTRTFCASPNTKVYLPVGNCLIGHIDKRDCMTTAWLHSGGVGQMLGYTVVTFYGYMGWGTGMLFDSGRHTLSEAFFLNNQALLHQLGTRFPSLLAVDPKGYGHGDIRAVQGQAGGGRDALGLLWDRDTVAFYGDPAWVARYPQGDGAARHRLEEVDGVWTLRVEMLRDGKWGDAKWGARPLFWLLPERIGDIREVTCEPAADVVVTDRFILLPVAGERRKGEVVTVRFKAREMKR